MTTPVGRLIGICKDLVGGLFSKYCEQIEPAAQLHGRVAIVTGATTGIGLETARALAWRGAHVILAGRSLERLSLADAKIRSDKPKQPSLSVESASDLKLTQLPIDLASLASVRDFAKAFLALNLPLHYLVNNAGIMMTPISLVTHEGFDGQMGSNHLGHFYLTKLLESKLRESGDSRIVCVSSAAHYGGKFTSDDIKSIFYPIVTPSRLVYSNSKLCNVLHAKELARRFQGSRVTAYSLHPGIVVTELARHLSLSKVVYFLIGWALKTPNQGATTSLYACLTPGLESENGNYFADCNVAVTNPRALDPKLATALWDASEYYINQFETGKLTNKKSD